VIRILGFERLPSTTISGRVPDFQPQPLRELRDRVKDVLVAAGGQEIITYSAVSEALLRRVTSHEDFEILRPLRIVNPMSVEHELMRTSLRGSMLETVAHNLKLRRPALKLFETAPIFLPSQERTELPVERELLVGALTGERVDRWGSASGDTLDFFDAKGMLETLASALGISFEYAAGHDSLMVSGVTADVSAAGRQIGVVGQVHPDVLAGFEIEGPLFLYELDLSSLLPLTGNVSRFNQISRFPPVQEDIALVVAQDVAAGDLIDAIRRSRLVTDTRVFDEYHGEPIPAGKKSLAIAVTYQAPDRTLTEADVARARHGILEGLHRRFGAELRS
jgi:phenylalanyl-tRNA synthetase beta chain